ncbi:MAG TPA: hypothetical protein ENH92_00210 [Ectothiorhodospiraceae bacterium]|nr:hypothetical protein [Ectothiorhodospiraceae bacterium]
MLKQLITTSFVIATITISTGAHALNPFDLSSLNQSTFDQLSEDLGASLSYKAMSPAEPLGITGFDIGLEVSATQLKSAAIFNSVTGSSFDTLPVPRLYIRKGLPLNIDVGISYLPGSISLIGYELSYAIMEGGIAKPALAVRLTSSKLSGSSDISTTTQGYELAVSKGFAMFTPYAGVGSIKVTTTPGSAYSGTLSKTSSTLFKTFYGFNMAFGLMSVAVEADRTGGINSYGAKMGFRF